MIFLSHSIIAFIWLYALFNLTFFISFRLSENDDLHLIIPGDETGNIERINEVEIVKNKKGELLTAPSGNSRQYVAYNPIESDYMFLVRTVPEPKMLN